MADGTGTLLAPKGPRAAEHLTRAAGQTPTVDELRAFLLSLPLPPAPTQTRTYPTDTMLGRVMRLKGWSIQDVVRLPLANIPNARAMSDYLAGRRRLGPRTAQAIARGLGVDWRVL